MENKQNRFLQKRIIILIIIIIVLLGYIFYIKIDNEVNTYPATITNECYELVEKYNQLMPIVNQNYRDLMTCYVRGISPCSALNQRTGYNYAYGINPNFVVPES